MMARLVAFISTAILICVLLAIVLYLRATGSHSTHITLDSPAVVKEVRQLNQLVTVKYGIEKVVGMKEEKSPLGEESILLLVQGKVLAGVDLGGLKPSDVALNGDVAVIRLPKPRIQEAFLDEKYTKVWDRSITWWTPWVTPDLDLEHKARMQALDDIRAAALQMGILDDARRNAELDIRNLLHAFGIEKADFAYGT